MNGKKYWASSKGMWLSGIVTTLGIVQATLQQYPLDPKVQGLIITGIGIAIGVVRVMTGEPVTAQMPEKKP